MNSRKLFALVLLFALAQACSSITSRNIKFKQYDWETYGSNNHMYRESESDFWGFEINWEYELWQ